MRMKSFWAVAIALLCLSCSNDDGTEPRQVEVVKPVVPEKGNKMKVYAHFMVWFESDTSNPLSKGKWGWHWTMNATDLDPSNGKIASWYHPLTGAYASGDPDILAYQCLLMKYSGIDGVIVDWYGSNADNTTARHTYNTEALFQEIEKTGLQFAVCYEDNSLGSADIEAARTDMTYLSSKFFYSENYVRIDGHPLLLDFGPQKIQDPHSWTRVFQILSTKPYFLALNGFTQYCSNEEDQNSMGEFLWVNPNPSQWYQEAKSKFHYVMGGAMPGFKDYYKEGGAGNGYTSYDDEGGKLLVNQLNEAKNAGLPSVQISTWNDYGEGTIIEPTKENGYRSLTTLQQFTGIKCTQSDLELIYKWYTLKKQYAGDSQKLRKLDEAFNCLNAMQPEQAKTIIESL